MPSELYLKFVIRLIYGIGQAICKLIQEKIDERPELPKSHKHSAIV
jgi:hypothetical protein